MNAPEPRDAEAGTPTNVPGTDAQQQPQRQRGSITSFLFFSFILFMLTNNRGDEIVVVNQYKEALDSMVFQLGNYSAWLNGTSANFSVVQADSDTTTLPLIESIMPFGVRLDPFQSSYYSNLTGFWKGDLQFYNLTSLPKGAANTSKPGWKTLADQFMANANMTNVTEVAERMGSWNWTASNKFTMSIRDKAILPLGTFANISQDIAIIHGKIDLIEPGTEEELRLEFDGVHFLSNGSIYTLAEPTGRFTDLREVSFLVPEHRLNETGHVIEAELAARLVKLQEKFSIGGMESPEQQDDGPISRCSFKFFGQTDPTNVPEYLMQELETEIQKPTGIATAKAPPLTIQGVLVSRNCGILYELKEATGVKSQGLYRKITTYAGTATLVNLILLFLLSRQITRSRSAAGLARVSRYPFFLQSLIDAVAFVGHITMAIIADGRPSISVVAPAGISCILFIYEAQFAVLIGQIQAPEDAETLRPQPAPLPPLPQSSQAQPGTTQDDSAERSNDGQSTPVSQPAPAAAVPRPPEPPRTFFRFFIHHIRTDPGARLWTIMSFCLIVVFRVVVMLSLPLLFIGSLYGFMWLPQLYRSAKRGRSSGLHAEYTIGVTLCRLFFILYFLVCPKNILDVEPRTWIWSVALLMGIQVGIIILQEHVGPAFFLPKRMTTQSHMYDYHPPIPLPDPEAPEQSLGDCSICMDAILVDPSLRQRGGDEKEQLLGLGGWGQAAGMKKSYSLAPCHHLFHTACLERWLAIKNICPQCRRPLPPL